MAHEHTGHGPDKKGDCPGCEAEYYDRVAAEMQRASENTRIAEWLRENAPKLVDGFLNETAPNPQANQVHDGGGS